MIIAPHKEKPRVAFVSTARFAEESFIKVASELLVAHGCEIVENPHLYAVENQFGGNDAHRFKSFQWAWEQPDVDVIWIVRGGYGSIRIAHEIDTLLANNKQPKWLVGYSDVTALHSLFQHHGVASIHGTMPVNFEKNSSDSIDSVLDFIAGKRNRMQWKSHAFNKLGEARGKLVGGNLSMLYSLQGTPYAADTKGNILFFEDLDEYLYHVDRMMQNLWHTKVLREASGIIIGALSDMNDNSTPFGKNAEEIVNSYTKQLGIPIAFAAPFGHVDRNIALLHGAEVSLKVDDSISRLDYVEKKG